MKACETCGGRGRVPHPLGFPGMGATVPCKPCKGSGFDCRQRSAFELAQEENEKLKARIAELEKK